MSSSNLDLHNRIALVECNICKRQFPMHYIWCALACKYYLLEECYLIALSEDYFLKDVLTNQDLELLAILGFDSWKINNGFHPTLKILHVIPERLI